MELNIGGKELGVDGLQAVCGMLPSCCGRETNFPDGLLSAIACDAVKLDELILSGCSLATQALPILAKVVRASSDTLQRLDLQGNDWEIKTSSALHDWEGFLESFKDCGNLRKLNFSNNRIGDKGIETFVRVYLRQLQNSVFEVDGEDDFAAAALSRSFPRLFSSRSDDEDDDISEADSSFGLDPSLPSALATALPIKPSRLRSEDQERIPTRGLPSVAYILLENVSMTDISVLHLTYFLPYHHLPHVLLRRLDAHIADSTAGRDDELYDRESFCRGVLYDFGNSDFSHLAKKLLEGVEKVRRAGGLTVELRATNPSFMGPFSSLPASPDSFRSRRNSDSARSYFPDFSSYSRRDSISNFRTATSAQLRSGSVVAFSQWNKADIMIYWAEVLKTRPKLQGEVLKSAKTVHVLQLWSVALKLLTLARIFTLPQPQKAPMSAISIARHNRRRPAPLRHVLPPSPVSPGKPQSFQLERSRCVGSLDTAIWMKILVPIADSQGILSELQAMKVVSWASDRDTLAREGEWAGKLAHVQIWRLLDVGSI